VFGTDDFSTHLSYSIGGTIFVTADPSLNLATVKSELIASMASYLNIDAEDISLSYNEYTGQVDYVINSCCYGFIIEIESALDDKTAFRNGVNDQIIDVDVISVDGTDAIIGQIEVRMRYDEVSQVNGRTAENALENFSGYEVSVSYVSPYPTGVPTVAPSMSPSSTVPSSAPHMTGLVVTVNSTTTVTEDIDDARIECIENALEDAFDVDHVLVDVLYSTEGRLAADSTITESTMKQALSETLGIHEKDISHIYLAVLEVETYIFTMSADSATAISELIVQIRRDSFLTALNAVMSKYEDVNVQSVATTGAIEASLQYSLSAEANADVQAAFASVNSACPGFDLDYTADLVTHAPSSTPSRFISESPTFSAPTSEPVTMIPTVAPTARGDFAFITLSQNPALSPISESEVNDIVDSITGTYDVSESEVDIEVDYIVEGEITLDLTGLSVSEDELLDVVEQLIADYLGTHVANIDLAIDDSGAITYLVHTSSLDIALSTAEELNAASFETSLSSTISEETGASVTEMSTSFDVTAEISAVVNLETSTINPLIAAESIESQFENQYNVDIEALVTITPAPTGVPTASPSAIPTTPVPTGTPSITGRVVSIAMIGAITSDVDADQIAATTADIYNIDFEGVTVAVSYSTSGSMNFTNLESLSESELETLVYNLETLLAEQLGIHAKDVELTVDTETNAIMYTVYGDSYSNVQVLMSQLDVTLANEISNTVANSGTGAEFITLSTTSEVIVEIGIAVDADGIRQSDLTTFSLAFNEAFSEFDNDFDFDVVTPAPTLLPTPAPTESCRDAAGWSNGHGFLCSDYVAEGWCANGEVQATYVIGARFNYPEIFCCECGRGSGNGFTTCEDSITELNDDIDNAQDALGTCLLLLEQSGNDPFKNDLATIHQSVASLSATSEEQCTASVDSIKDDWMTLIDEYQATLEEEFRSIYENLGITMSSVDKSSYAFRVGNSSMACVDWTRYDSTDPTDPDFGTMEVLTDIPDRDTCQLFCGFDSNCLAYEFNSAIFSCALIYTEVEMVPSQTTECYFKTTIPVDVNGLGYCPCSPTMSPVFYPSLVPHETTHIPSALPSTGSGKVTAAITIDSVSSLEESEISAVTDAFVSSFALDDYALIVTYESRIVVGLLCTDGVDANVGAVEQAVAQALELHVKDTNVVSSSTTQVVISVPRDTYEDAVAIRNSKARSSFTSEVARYVPHFTSDACSTTDIDVQAAIAASIELIADLTSFEDLSSKRDSFESQIPFAYDDLSLTLPSDAFFPSKAPVVSPSKLPSVTPSTSPSKGPSVEPTMAPTQTNKVFSIIWVVDADSKICNEEPNCENRERIVKFMQNVTDSLMLDYSEVMMITYDSVGVVQFEGGYNSKADYVQALDDSYILDRPFSVQSSGFSILVSEIGTKAFNPNHNHIIFFLTEGYNINDNPSRIPLAIYKNFMPATPQLPMVVIGISDRLEDLESQFSVWTDRAGLGDLVDPNTNTFFGFDTIDDLNSETVLDRLLSDETDLGDLQLRLD